MKCIEYRYTQGIDTLKAVIQLNANGKYWNESKGHWRDELEDGCKMRLVELSAANVYNSNIDQFEFMTLYKDKIEDGLYVYGSKLLSIAPGALYSIHIYDGETLVSTTQRYEGSSMRFFDMIKEVQGRLGFPLSKRLSEPNAKKIGMMMNDVITELLPSGRSTQNAVTLYRGFLPAESKELLISPVNCRALNGLGMITINDSPVVQVDGTRITSFITNQRSIPNSYIVSTKANRSIGITFNSSSQDDLYVDCEVFERPTNLVFAGDRTVYDSDLVIKGTEYIARDDFGMGGDVSGRELFMRYLIADSNLNEDTNWSNFRV